jgi:beta-phosphoglucomutase-like phosphatase (HAD superfamily)
MAIVTVEDSPRGLLAARAAGIACIVIRSELTAAFAFDEARAVVDSNEELRDALLEFLRLNGGQHVPSRRARVPSVRRSW